MRLSVLYTSARPNKIAKVLECFLRSSMLPDLEIEFIVSTKDMFIPKKEDKRVHYVNYGDKCPDNAVMGWNYAAEFAAGDVFFCISDDLEPMHIGWDEAILNHAEKHPEDMGIQIWSTDRIFRKKLGLWAMSVMYHPVVRKKVFDMWGYIFHPGFQSMFCDNTITTMLHGVTGECFDAKFNHKQRMAGAKIDGVTQRHESTEAYRVGQELINRLAAEKFNPKAHLPEWWATYKKEFSK